MDLYGQLYAYFDGALCTDAIKCVVKYEGEDQEVSTLVKGFAGISPGPKKLIVSYNGAVPTGDTFCTKVIKAFLNSAEVPIRVVSVAGQKIETTGFVRPGPQWSAGAGETSMLDFEVVCAPAEPQ